ncbi:MAG: HlyD family secretion protein [Chitinophagaceae bacterium]|nr:HlyD family secretion protein [Chitinophagaceae bacterium]
MATDENKAAVFSLNGQGQKPATLKNSFAEQHNEIEQIISARPPLFVRWGTMYFLLLLSALAIVCWFIQYPDLVSAKARLNSINAPKEVVTKTEGKLQSLFIKNGDSVAAGTVLGYMESVAKPTAVFQIKRQTDTIASLISENSTNEIVNYFPDYARQQYLNELGELQQPFQTFMQSFISFRDYISNGFYLRKRTMLQTDMGNIQRLLVILNEQKELLQEDVQLSNETLSANETLLKEKVISPLDYRNEKSKLIARQLTLPQIKSSIVTNESQQNEKRKEIAELENQVLIQKNNFIQALQTFNNQLQQWELKYILKAPVSGKVFYTSFFQENQQVKNGQLLFYVQPGNSSCFAEMLIPQYNFGKIKKGQEVFLKFQAYPYEQFGSVTGKIEFISETPSDSGFLAKVILSNGLVTNYQKSLQFKSGLLAQADIVTDNMRLLERFYYNIIKQLKR